MLCLIFLKKKLDFLMLHIGSDRLTGEIEVGFDVNHRVNQFVFSCRVVNVAHFITADDLFFRPFRRELW